STALWCKTDESLECDFPFASNKCYAPRCRLHSFPTRRSSDLAALTNDLRKVEPGRAQYTHLLDEADASVLDDIIVWWVSEDIFRSEEHTSELQSRENLVCRLLLDKKNALFGVFAIIVSKNTCK